MTNAVSNISQTATSSCYTELVRSCDCYLTQKIWQVFKENVLENRYFYAFSFDVARGFFLASGAIIAVILYSPFIKEVFGNCVRGH
jgi:hypothetical protein